MKKMAKTGQAFKPDLPLNHDCMEGVEDFLASGGLVCCVKQSNYDR